MSYHAPRPVILNVPTSPMTLYLYPGDFQRLFSVARTIQTPYGNLVRGALDAYLEMGDREAAVQEIVQTHARLPAPNRHADRVKFALGDQLLERLDAIPELHIPNAKSNAQESHIRVAVAHYLWSGVAEQVIVETLPGLEQLGA